jgi:ankyrin repeat protein
VLSYAASVTEDPETVIPLLLKAGADVNTTDFTGATPIMYAAFQSPNPAATVRVLLGRGASLAIKDTTGRTALDFAQLNPEKSAETISVLKSFRTPNAAGFTHNQPLPARQ